MIYNTVFDLNTLVKLNTILTIIRDNDQKIQTDVIGIDFDKAFDKVPHKRLL